MTERAGVGQSPRTNPNRRLMTWLCVGFGVLFITAAVIVSLLTGTAFQWAAVLFIGGIIGFLFAAFVWIRLAE